MKNDNDKHVPQFHLHLHEGASPEAVRAAVEGFSALADEAPRAEVRLPSISGDEKIDLAIRSYRESEGNMKPLLDYLAKNPDRQIPYAEVSEALDFDNARSLPGLLGAFGRRTNHRYGGFWPFERTWSDAAWSWQLRMDAETAQAIKSL